MFGWFSDKNSFVGPYSFTATGDLVGEFSGTAVAQYTGPFSDAGNYYKIVLIVTTELFDSLPNRGIWLMFTRRHKPDTGTFSLHNEKPAAVPEDQRFRVVLGGRTDHNSIIWNGVDGELRIEKDQKNRGSLKGEFWATFSQRNGDDTRTTRITGQFDMR